MRTRIEATQYSRHRTVKRTANARIESDGQIVTVKADDVPAPVAVRFGWRNAPDATLHNTAGLSTVPIRTDN